MVIILVEVLFLKENQRNKKALCCQADALLAAAIVATEVPITGGVATSSSLSQKLEVNF